jgi:hypothetical protein
MPLYQQKSGRLKIAKMAPVIARALPETGLKTSNFVQF